ncbi:protein FANTASTIC FOUR 3 [Capsicum galapagoense]
MSQILDNVSSLSFIQILKTPSSYHYQPSTKLHSSVIMSATSLEMCTETLGSETGCYYNDDMDETNFSCGIQRSECHAFMQSVKRKVDFPPPLTSISGMERVRVRSYRGGGRLVLRAVSVSNAYNSYFKAERASGTLRLSWRYDSKMEVEQNCEEQMANGCRKLTRRCKEKCGSTSKGISNYCQFWVAIS